MPTTYVDPLVSGIQLPISELLVDDTQLTASVAAVQEVKIQQGEGMHDSATIVLKFNSTRLDDYVNKPVSFTYGPRARFGRFFGYVSNVVPSRNYKEDLTATFECLGVTWIMRYGYPRFFLNRTTEQIVREVVEPHKLGALIDTFKLSNMPYQWPSTAQTGESDFEFLSNVVHRVGFSLFVNDGVIRILDPIQTLKTGSYFLTLIKSDDVNDNSRTLLDFEPETQSQSARDTQEVMYGYFADFHAAVVSDSSLKKRFDVDQPVVDQLMADAYRQAWNNIPERWPQQAVARIMGDTSIAPGTLISIRLSGSSVIRNDYDGVWLILGIDHSLTQNSFQSGLRLARMPVVRSGASTNQQWYQSLQRARPYLLKRVRGDETVWESSWAGIPEASVQMMPRTSTGIYWRAS